MRYLFLVVMISVGLSTRGISPSYPLSVIIMHGIKSHAQNMAPLAYKISQAIKNIYVKCLVVRDSQSDEVATSYKNLWYQIELAKHAIDNDPQLCRKPIIGIGISQGGLILRGVQQHHSSPNRPHFHTLMTLGTPHGGFCGISGDLSEQIREAIKYEELDLATKNYLQALLKSLSIRSRRWTQGAILAHLNSNKQRTSAILYTKLLQKYFSVAGFWKNPEAVEDYLKYCTVLPQLNNEIVHPLQEHYRDNVRSLQKFVAVASPYDEIVDPISSPHWGSYHSDTYSETTLIKDFKKTDQYTKNLLGLRDLHDTGRLHLERVNCRHGEYSTCDEAAQLIIHHIQKSIESADYKVSDYISSAA